MSSANSCHSCFHSRLCKGGGEQGSSIGCCSETITERKVFVVGTTGTTLVNPGRCRGMCSCRYGRRKYRDVACFFSAQPGKRSQRATIPSRHSLSTFGKTIIFPASLPTAWQSSKEAVTHPIDTRVVVVFSFSIVFTPYLAYRCARFNECLNRCTTVSIPHHGVGVPPLGRGFRNEAVAWGERTRIASIGCRGFGGNASPWRDGTVAVLAALATGVDGAPAWPAEWIVACRTPFDGHLRE